MLLCGLEARLPVGLQQGSRDRHVVFGDFQELTKDRWCRASFDGGDDRGGMPFPARWIAAALD